MTNDPTGVRRLVLGLLDDKLEALRAERDRLRTEYNRACQSREEAQDALHNPAAMGRVSKPHSVAVSSLSPPIPRPARKARGRRSHPCVVTRARKLHKAGAARPRA